MGNNMGCDLIIPESIGYSLWKLSVDSWVFQKCDQVLSERRRGRRIFVNRPCFIWDALSELSVDSDLFKKCEEIVREKKLEALKRAEEIALLGGATYFTHHEGSAVYRVDIFPKRFEIYQIFPFEKILSRTYQKFFQAGEAGILFQLSAGRYLIVGFNRLFEFSTPKRDPIVRFGFHPEYFQLDSNEMIEYATPDVFYAIGKTNSYFFNDDLMGGLTEENYIVRNTKLPQSLTAVSIDEATSSHGKKLRTKIISDVQTFDWNREVNDCAKNWDETCSTLSRFTFTGGKENLNYSTPTKWA